MNGVINEIEPTGQEAADRRHPPVINRVQFPSAGHDEIKVGEMLFEGSRENASHQATYGATKAAEASKKTLTGTGDGTATAFNFDFGEVVPGSVKIVTNDSTAKEVTDNGDGTLGGESESGTGTVDYATGHVTVTFTAAPANTKTVTATAISGAGFVGIANDALDASEDDGVNVVLHGTIFEGIAKYNGSAASKEQLKFLSRHGIW